MICQRCKGKGWAIVLVKQKEGFYHTEQAECPECHGKGFVEQTNEEWLRSCTTEQLAEWMALRLNPGILLALRMKYHCTDINAAREWLKEKHD